MHRYLFFLVVLPALPINVAACVRQPSSVAVEGSGDSSAFVVECSDMVDCTRKARQSCPSGYEIAATGAVERVDPVVAFAEGLDNKKGASNARYSNQQMMIECKSGPQGPELSDRPSPAGAAGFVLDSKLDRAQLTCEQAGFAWSQRGDWYRCEGFPTETPMDGYAMLRFCEDRLCAIRLTQRPDAPDDTSWMKRVDELHGLLTKRYGAHGKDESLLYACRSGGVACHEKRDLALKYAWQWNDGHAIDLVVRTDPPRGPVTVLTYAGPAFVREREAQSL